MDKLVFRLLGFRLPGLDMFIYGHLFRKKNVWVETKPYNTISYHCFKILLIYILA